MTQLKRRFEGQRLASAQRLDSFILDLCVSDVDWELAAIKLQQTFSSDIGPDFMPEIRFFGRDKFNKDL